MQVTVKQSGLLHGACRTGSKSKDVLALVLCAWSSMCVHQCMQLVQSALLICLGEHSMLAGRRGGGLGKLVLKPNKECVAKGPVETPYHEA